MQPRNISNQRVTYTLFGVYTVLWILSLAQSEVPDVHVTCIYSENCIMPCSFPPTDDEVVVQWYQQGELIYSFQEDEDEPDDSSLSLFTDEVSNGNASLLLKDSKIKSRGRYRCMVNTTKSIEESFVIVRVEAPINRISIEASPTGHVQCSSHGVYPAPVLTWSTDPRVSPGNQPITRMSADSNGLYSVDSTLKKLNKSSPPTYTCTITPKYSSQAWKASLLQTEMVVKDGQDLVIPCMAPRNLKHFTLSWTFTKGNKNNNILSYSSKTDIIINNWEHQAELNEDKALKGDGSLYINNLQGLKHSGKYTCSFSGDQTKYIVQTSVNFDASIAVTHTGDSKSKLWVLAVVVAVLALLGVLYYVYKKYKSKSKHSSEDTEMQVVHKDKTAEELPAENTPLSDS